MKTATANAEYPEILSDLVYQVSETLTKNGIAKKQAGIVADAVAERLSQHWGGQLIYFPKGAVFRRMKRDLEILRKWNGRNALELCREFGITRGRLYQILKPTRTKRTDS